MANGTWDEASKCPKCGLTGKENGSRLISRQAGVTRGAKLIELVCKNTRCRWYNSPWEVQVNPDGTIPDPNAPRHRDRPRIDMAMVAQQRAMAERIQEASMKPGGEIRNR